MVNAQRFRARKVDLKRALPVYRASDLDDLDDDDNRQVDAIETGVEKDEEAEHHLQAAISSTQAAASGSAPAKQVYIPTPDASRVTASYAQLYAQPFTCPTSLVRSSETVEESCGPLYCADKEDLRWADEHQVPVDEFERTMDVLENVTRDMVFGSTADVPSAEYLAAYAGERDQPVSKQMVARVYEHWRARRAGRGFRPILPQVQIHDGSAQAAGAEIDPYVCFRRREVRQGRKTRRADQRSLEQLRRLRANLAAAAQMLEMCGARERDKMALVEMAQEVARARTHVLGMRRRLHATDASPDDLFVPPAQQQRRQKAQQTQRPRAGRKPRETPGQSAVPAGPTDLAPTPFVLPRTLSVPQYPVPARLAALAEGMRARALAHEARMAGWVDATYARPTGALQLQQQQQQDAARFWALPQQQQQQPPQLQRFVQSGLPGAFRVRAGRLGRMFVDRRTVRRADGEMGDARVRRFCAALLRPEDHARLAARPAYPAAVGGQADALAALLRPFSFGSVEALAAREQAKQGEPQLLGGGAPADAQSQLSGSTAADKPGDVLAAMLASGPPPASSLVPPPSIPLF
ncbi:Enhancer of polycomb-like protein 1 [Coemansia erecta]|uniref:Enhancer of polycomb-like protein n=1 Tax=Coemansia erecta TaxID=147472 RepID=A0A9W8CU42_9FUNG|nr:Enhancer of polycomb-like protein 1 [Coemansia erecta]